MLLNDKLKPYRLLLASQSPRRRELMTGCGLPYELAEKFDCEETYPDDLPLIGVSEYLSTLKSEAYPVPLLENDILAHGRHRCAGRRRIPDDGRGYDMARRGDSGQTPRP